MTEQCSMRVQPLKALLRSWGLEPLILGGLDGMSDELEAQIVPSCSSDDDNLLTFVADGIPVLAPIETASRVFEVSGHDGTYIDIHEEQPFIALMSGLAFVSDSRWDKFSKPKVPSTSVVAFLY